MEERGKEQLGMTIKVVYSLYRRINDAYGNRNYIKGLCGSNLWIIGYLTMNEGKDVFQKDLEKQFSIRRSTASKTLQLMEDKGLIRREPVFYDARLKKIILTEKAHEIQKMIVEDVTNANKIASEGITEEEFDAFYNVMEKMKNNLEAYINSKE